jgi:ubiquinone/menaquinone biosynthesis C-methylase UbiE
VKAATIRAVAGQQAQRLRGMPARMVDRMAPKKRVDRYWTRHMVRSDDFATPEESAEYLEWRFSEYPLFREFSGLWGNHDGQVVLDYGCGPGNDVVGFLIHTGAAEVIGVDVSAKALELARERVELHGVEPSRYRLIEVTDAEHTIPLPDASVDFFQSQGVLHHTTDPEEILRQIHRVLRPGGEGRIMVYNRASIWFHLYAAYEVQVRDGLYPDLSAEDAFQHTTDGPDCPIALCFAPEDFVALCDRAGFDTEFLGGYLSRHELETLERSRDAAIADERLAAEHRDFLRELELDGDGYPTWRGKHAGVGGSYALRRLDSSE